MQLKDLRIGYELAKKLEVSPCYQSILTLHSLSLSLPVPSPSQSEAKWKQLAELAMSKCQFGLALECLYHAQDFGDLLLLATSAGDAGTMEKLSELSAKEGQSNIGFLTNFLLGRLEVCLEILIKTGRLPEAAFFARTYLPSQISR